MKPIDEIEADFRRNGSFLLSDTDGVLRYYGTKSAKSAKLIESLKGRGKEMSKFLIDRASVRNKRGET